MMNIRPDNPKKRYPIPSVMIVTVLFLAGCQTVKPIPTVEKVDLKRFMGDWYVIANIPTAIEKNAFNAIESYRLNSDGTVATRFTFNKGSFDGPLKTYDFKGFVANDSSKALWKMQIIWPLRAEYRIIYLNDDYSQTVIGRSKRDYVWIMARNTSIPNTDYQQILALLEEKGYDIEKIQKIPHKDAVIN